MTSFYKSGGCSTFCALLKVSWQRTAGPSFPKPSPDSPWGVERKSTVRGVQIFLDSGVREANSHVKEEIVSGRKSPYLYLERIFTHRLCTNAWEAELFI